MRQNTLTLSLFIFFLYLLPSSYVAAAPEQIGEVVFTRGAVSAKNSTGQLRVLGKKAAVYQGDIVTTGSKSFSVIKMTDGARISVRPNTTFSFENYSAEADNGKGSAVMRLLKGGLRAVSGLIAKRNPDAFRLQTAVATIGIRGTDFDARLCELDCAIEQGNQEQVKVDNSIARVAFMSGSATATAADNRSRSLSRGDALYEGDVLKTDRKSYLVVVFNDDSRMSLKADTELQIKEHKYKSAEPEKSSAVYKLIKGGMRALTGLIGKYKKDAYQVETPTATIGIRGTGFDLVWLGPCSGGATGCGLSGSVWLGSIYTKNEAGQFEMAENQSFIVRLPNSPADIITTPPDFDIPRPDKVEINTNELFGEQEDTPEGLYANTREGIVFIERDGKEIELQRNEGGFVSKDGSLMVKLDVPKAFQTNDPYLRMINEEFETLYELLDENVIEQDEFQCTVQ